MTVRSLEARVGKLEVLRRRPDELLVVWRRPGGDITEALRGTSFAKGDKVICADAETVELGSFNYSDAAARRNSENVLVNWRNPKLAEAYLQHFERNYRQSDPYQPRY